MSSGQVGAPRAATFIVAAREEAGLPAAFAALAGPAVEQAASLAAAAAGREEEGAPDDIGEHTTSTTAAAPAAPSSTPISRFLLAPEAATVQTRNPTCTNSSAFRPMNASHRRTNVRRQFPENGNVS